MEESNEKENTVLIGVKLQKSTDSDIIEYLNGKVRQRRIDIIEEK